MAVCSRKSRPSAWNVHCTSWFARSTPNVIHRQVCTVPNAASTRADSWSGERRLEVTFFRRFQAGPSGKLRPTVPHQETVAAGGSFGANLSATSGCGSAAGARTVGMPNVCHGPASGQWLRSYIPVPPQASFWQRLKPPARRFILDCLRGSTCVTCLKNTGEIEMADDGRVARTMGMPNVCHWPCQWAAAAIQHRGAAAGFILATAKVPGQRFHSGLLEMVRRVLHG